MRQKYRRIHGALIVIACIAAPGVAPAMAHALTVSVPGVADVAVGDAGNVNADVLGLSVGVQPPPVPAAPSDPIPSPPALPDPVAGPVGGARDTGNGAINQATGNGGDGSSPAAATPSGNSGGGGSAGSGNSGNNGGGSGGNGTPRTRGGGSAGGGGSGRGGARGATPRQRARARRAARRAGNTPGGQAVQRSREPASSGKDASSGREKKTSTNPVARVINRIEEVIPGPIWALIGLLALLAGGFAIRSRLVSRRAARLERQREELLGDVGLLQRALLPDVPENLRGIEVSVAYRPAEGPAAGGDFYDVFELDSDRTAIIVGDVCGHGRQALAVTALMRYTLRAYLGAGFEPRVALKVAGRTIDGDPDGELTTVVLAVYDARAGTLTYACAGHEPPIVLGPASHDPVTVSSSPPLGGFMATGHRQTTVALPSGSAVCFFTDGLVEARLGENMIGRERLTQLVTELAPGEGAQLLLERLASTADRAPDDMAACLLRTRDEAVESREVRVEELEADAQELAGQRVRDFLGACGIPAGSAEETLRAARAKASEFGGAVLRVHVAEDGGRVEIVPSEVAALPVPTLAADARARAALTLGA